MKAAIRKLGNSQGVIIPKPILAQVGLVDEAVMTIENDALVLRPARRSRREGWAAASRRIADSNDDALTWPEFANANDAHLKW
ncbi:MAG: AbrB/MazE/SpoVT family DNA-binding domain-containing protein [Rhodanobacteraceae bacterium]|nr:MAG: AbrB/MazE/SpoVT family DNA-binding domain-containing protein [Rhodanobacteraceae bacterium]